MQRFFLTAIAAGIMIVFPSVAETQYLENPSFEKIDGKGIPESWGVTAWGADQLNPTAMWSAPEQPGTPTGNRVAQITTTRRHFATIVQQLKGLVPGQCYELTAMVRCEQLDGHGSLEKI